MKTRSEKFVFENRERWLRLRDIAEKISRSSYRSLSEEDVEDFPRLFRLTCKDLAEARMLRLSSDVLAYLNNVIGLSYKYLYHFPLIRSVRLKQFFTRQLPVLFHMYWRYLLAAALLFLLPLGISYMVVAHNPEYAALLTGEEVLVMMEESYATEPGGERSWSMSAMAVSYYIQHNTSIAFLSFATGILAGLGTVYFMIYNGLFLGTIAGYISALGFSTNFRNFITAHSVFELCGLIIAGAAGLFLGNCIIKANTYRRRDWLNLQKGNILKLLSPAVFFLFAAACIEGLLSPLPLAYGIKLLVAGLSACFIIYYFVLHRYLYNLPLKPAGPASGGEPGAYEG